MRNKPRTITTLSGAAAIAAALASTSPAGAADTPWAADAFRTHHVFGIGCREDSSPKQCVDSALALSLRQRGFPTLPEATVERHCLVETPSEFLRGKKPVLAFIDEHGALFQDPIERLAQGLKEEHRSLDQEQLAIACTSIAPSEEHLAEAASPDVVPVETGEGVRHFGNGWVIGVGGESIFVSNWHILRDAQRIPIPRGRLDVGVQRMNNVDIAMTEAPKLPITHRLSETLTTAELHGRMLRWEAIDIDGDPSRDSRDPLATRFFYQSVMGKVVVAPAFMEIQGISTFDNLIFMKLDPELAKRMEGPSGSALIDPETGDVVGIYSTFGRLRVETGEEYAYAIFIGPENLRALRDIVGAHLEIVKK